MQFVLSGRAMLEDELASCGSSIVAQTPEGKLGLPDADALAALSVDELWKFRGSIDVVLMQKIAGELANLKGRLEILNGRGTRKPSSRKNQNLTAEGRRPYPSVLPKYRNPKRPSETWSGRGRLPRWVQLLLGSGKQLQDFLIS